MTDEYSTRVAWVANAEPVRELGEPVVQRPDLGAGGGIKAEASSVRSTPPQPWPYNCSVSMNCMTSFHVAMLCMAQQADIVARACPWRGRGSAREFSEHEWMGNRLIGSDQMHEGLVASAKMVDPHRSIDQHVHCPSASGQSDRSLNDGHPSNPTVRHEIPRFGNFVRHRSESNGLSSRFVAFATLSLNPQLIPSFYFFRF